MAQKDKERYEREMAEYKAKGGRAVSTTPVKTCVCCFYKMYLSPICRSSKTTSSSKNTSPSKVAKSKEFVSSESSSDDDAAATSGDDDE
jgi:hypothetical protein